MNTNIFGKYSKNSKPQIGLISYDNLFDLPKPSNNGEDGLDGKSIYIISYSYTLLGDTEILFSDGNTVIVKKGDKGNKGDGGENGLAPEHEWSGTFLRFKNPNNTWGNYTNLKGDKGNKGDIGESGESIEVVSYSYDLFGNTDILFSDASTVKVLRGQTGLSSYNFTNGTILDTINVKLGGSLTENTTIATDGYSFYLGDNFASLRYNQFGAGNLFLAHDKDNELSFGIANANAGENASINYGFMNDTAAYGLSFSYYSSLYAQNTYDNVANTAELKFWKKGNILHTQNVGLDFWYGNPTTLVYYKMLSFYNNKVGIGNFNTNSTDINSTLHLKGSYSTSGYTGKIDNYTITADDYIVTFHLAAVNRTCTIPVHSTANFGAGKRFIIRNSNTSTGNLTIQLSGADKFDGGISAINSLVLLPNQSVEIISFNNSNWSVLSSTIANTGSGFVPYTGATQNVNLGVYDLIADSIIKNGGTSSQFLKADGSIDSTAYYPNSNPSGFITSSALNPYLLSSTAESTYYPLTNPSGFITSAALSELVPYTGATANVNLGSFTITTGADATINGIRVGRGSGNDFSNTAIGLFALGSNNTGTFNTAIGVFALGSNTTGYKNTALGLDALSSNTTGYQNIALGVVGLRSNTTGNSNTAIGNYAGWGTGVNSNTTGSNNIFIGNESVGVDATESNRTWIGNSNTTSTWLGGNLLLGTTTNNGVDRLQVDGRAIITQGVVTLGGYRFSDEATGMWADVFGIRFVSYLTGPELYNFTAEYSTNNAWTSGGSIVAITAGLGATSGANRDRTSFRINPVVNYTGGATGISRAIHINPTLTSAPDWRSIDIGNNSGYAIYQSGASALNLFNGDTTFGKLAGTGTRIVTADINGALAKILGASSQYVRGDGSLATFPSITGLVPYTGATANVDLGTFDLTADVITGTIGSYTSSGNGNTLSVTHSSGSGIALNITKSGNGEGLYINKTSGSGNAATIIGTLNATTLVKSGGTSSQFLKADGSIDSNSYLTSINGIAAGGDLSGTYQSPNVSGLLGSPLPFFGGISGDTLLLGKDISTGDWTTISLSNIITFSKLSEPLYVYTDLFGNKFLDIRVATASQNGVLSSSAFTTFTNKQNAITLTTTGTSGAATFLGDTLNVPNYTLAGLDGVPTGRTLTINGTAFDLSANRSWNVGTVTGVTGTTNRITSSGGATPIIDIASTYVGQLSITTLGTIGTGVWQGTAIGDAYISSAAIWNAKIGGSLTTGYLPVATGAGTVANSVLFQNGNNVGIGVSPLYNLHIQDSKALGLYSYLENTSSNSIASASYIAKSQSGVTIGMTALNQGGGALINSSHNLTIEASGGGGMVLQTNGQIITNGAVNSGEHFIIGGSARISGVVTAPQISTTKQTLTPTGTTQTIDWNNGSIVDILLSSATGNVTLTLLNAQNASSYLIEVTNGATPRNLIFPTGTLQSNGGGNVYVGTANQKDVIAVLWDGTQYLISISKNYS